MTNRDPARGSALDLSLRNQLAAMERRRAQQYAQWDALLAENTRKLDGQAQALETSIAALRAKAAEVRAELDEDDTEATAEPQGQPPAEPIPGQPQLRPEDIARMPLGSSQHMALRREFGMSRTPPM
jgi:uncharacterized protein involved in exopolysaccharide biosynthesis